ncbi:hypothetical protein RND81_01G146900 [Saponaria officinalis]|uniref:RIN4 pathogenic type III effector avirulence factor Avr cleavage site domain-containing protein n=1 Tax=Saponaria officinalis TaxID=3572 RepID=A0AAW1NES0_SAPOF
MSKVPKFGAWEANENFTVYFDTARKTKNNGQKINPNDPEENPDLFGASTRAQAQAAPSQSRKDEKIETKRGGPSYAEDEPRAQARPVTAKAETKEPRPQYVPTPAQEGRAKVPQFGAWNGGEGAQYTAYFDTARKAKNEGGEPVMNRDVSDKPRPTPATKVRAEAKDDVQRNESRGSTSSVTGSDGLAKQPSVPKVNAQSRPAGGRANKAAAVPEFGGWNKPKNEPSQEGYTIAFARAKEERNTPLNSAVPPSYQQQPQYNNQKQASCCTIL